MKYSNDSIVGQIVADNYQTAAVFSKYGIDFCCRGNRSLKEVAIKNNLSVDEIIGELQNLIYKDVEQINFKAWDLALLADYIEKTHHRYVRKRIPEIIPYLAKVVKVHGKAHPELYDIANEFDACTIELNAHMQKEELNLFPHIRKLVEIRDGLRTWEEPAFGSVKYPIQQMMEEHDQEGVRFRKIRSLTKDYTPPEDACQTYRVTYAMLEEFEKDLHRHIHLENNILFPKAAELEKRLGNN